ncbi:MAG: hypothetical protein E6J89_10880 [Deltaproteobacteria bacterium]|nr:MAG: hypothetical protein E6J89_10880 [Deltaproteobacteria bacterium]
MVDENIEARQVPASQEVGTGEQTEGCSIEKRGWLKGPLGMAICCGGPLLLVAAISLFGVSLGTIASGALSLAAVLACPVGMYLMMRMMMNKK